MPRLPILSGREIIKALNKLGYEEVRQRGSHIRLSQKEKINQHLNFRFDLEQFELWNNLDLNK